ncbi:Origin of replication complex subunit 1 [Spatholobus suberectus]|nr:Origin of replication complex subunit 1 [Spatholobus suberectus]
MAATPSKSFQTPSKRNLRSQSNPKSSPAVTPDTPQTLHIRRSTRAKSLLFDSPKPPQTPREVSLTTPKRRTRRSVDYADDDSGEDKVATRTISARNNGPVVDAPKKKNGKGSIEVSFAPVTPASSEKTSAKKRKREGEGSVLTRVKRGKSEKNREQSAKLPERRFYYKKVVYDGGEFGLGDDVYVKRREDASSDDEDPEIEECRLCFFSSDDEVMIECDDCLGGYHLKCLKPPLKDVPEGDWTCGFCEARKMGRGAQFPKPPKGKKLVRTMREKLLSSDVWAASY